MSIDYVKGDATRPIPYAVEQGIIAHGCNDQGAWGVGFTGALDEVSPTPRREYHAWYMAGEDQKTPFKGGNLILASYDDSGILVANMITQHGIGNTDPPPVRYLWIASCFNKLRGIATAYEPHASIHMPRIGCGLAGGQWDKVELLIEQFLTRYNVRVRVYDLQ